MRLSNLLFAFALLLPICAFAEDIQVEVMEDVVFSVSKFSGGETIDRIMNVYKAVGNEDKLSPAIVILHGNPGDSPYPNGRQRSLEGMAKYLAVRGFTCFVVAWDLRELFVPIEQAVIHIRECAERYDIDPKRLGVIGHSYGARHACTLATADFVDPRAKVQACVMLAGGMSYPDDCDEDDPPIFFIYGTADPWHFQAEAILKSLSNNNTPHVYFDVEGGGHFIPWEQEIAFKKSLAEFIESFLAKTLSQGPEHSLQMLTKKHKGKGRICMGEAKSYGMYPTNDTVVLTATPDDGQKFSHWEDSDGNPLGTAPELSVEMKQDRTVIAVFSEKD